MNDQVRKHPATPGTRTMSSTGRSTIMARPTIHPESAFRVSERRIVARPEQREPEPLAVGVVARGRSVHASIPGQYRDVGWNPDTKEPVRTLAQKIYMPGDAIELPVSELVRLKRAGFIRDESKIAPAATTGNRAKGAAA